MSAMANHRAALREGRMQQRIKARVAAWWHATHCSDCKAKADLFAMLGIDKGEPAPSPDKRHLN